MSADHGPHAIADSPELEQRDASVGLSCMEIWGGSDPVHQAISVPGIDAYVRSEPHDGGVAGGDIHYLSLCGAGNISRYVIADVSGHGEAVGRIAGSLRKLMRKHINRIDQSRFAMALNEEFSQLSGQGQFATAILLTYFAPTDELIICNAGHPRPLWYQASLNRWTLLHETVSDEREQAARDRVMHDLPLGVIEPTDYHQFVVALEPGDLVVVYTDALIESADAEGSQLGEQGLIELVRSIGPESPERLCNDLLCRVGAIRDSVDPGDDQTVMVLHHNATNPPSQSIGDRLRVLGRMMGLGG